MDYQDMLAQVGAGSAHPGGMGTTEQWLAHVDLQPGDHVLEVGCGTGRTLLEVKRRFDCDVTGVDVRPMMVAKAKQRALAMGQHARFVVGNAQALQFASNTFDLVITESVHVFCDSAISLAECCRVLKPGGRLVDVEMVVMEPVTDDWREGVKTTYGATSVPDLAGWKRLYAGAGFTATRTLSMRRVVPDEAMISEQRYPDPVDLSSRGTYHNPQVLSVLELNAKWLEHNHHALGYAVFLNHKGMGQG